MYTELVQKAIYLATKLHGNQKRKGSDIDYIVHPYEVAMILMNLKPENSNENLVIAGLLHDVVEDTEYELVDIELYFGEKIAKLIGSNSEDKTKTWEERKQHTVQDLKNRTDEELLLIFADKCSNVMSMAKDYNILGENVWLKFKRGKDVQISYYQPIYNFFKEFLANKTIAEVTKICNLKTYDSLFVKMKDSLEIIFQDQFIS